MPSACAAKCTYVFPKHPHFVQVELKRACFVNYFLHVIPSFAWNLPNHEAYITTGGANGAPNAFVMSPDRINAGWNKNMWMLPEAFGLRRRFCRSSYSSSYNNIRPFCWWNVQLKCCIFIGTGHGSYFIHEKSFAASGCPRMGAGNCGPASVIHYNTANTGGSCPNNLDVDTSSASLPKHCTRNSRIGVRSELECGKRFVAAQAVEVQKLRNKNCDAKMEC